MSDPVIKQTDEEGQRCALVGDAAAQSFNHIMGAEQAMVIILVPMAGGAAKYVCNVGKENMEEIIQHVAVEGLLNGAVNHHNIALPKGTMAGNNGESVN